MTRCRRLPFALDTISNRHAAVIPARAIDLVRYRAPTLVLGGCQVLVRMTSCWVARVIAT